MTRNLFLPALFLSSLAFAGAALAAGAGATINAISAEGIGADIGTAKFADGDGGLSITLEVKGISAGEHGVHVHENGSCDAQEKDGKMVAGLGAGPHFDPDKAGKHAGPHGEGHKGDLPKLLAEGKTTKATLVAPRLKLADVVGRALIIHEGGDTYSDDPALGGGKARIACGIIKAE